MKAVEPQRNTRGRFVRTADPAILKRIRGCPFARGGRVLVRFRANGDSLFARRSGEPLVRLRLTGEEEDVVLLDRALQRFSANPYFLKLRQTYG